MTSQKNTSMFEFNMYNSYTEVNISLKIVKKNKKNMAVIQPRPTHIIYQCAKPLTCVTFNM